MNKCRSEILMTRANFIIIFFDLDANKKRNDSQIKRTTTTRIISRQKRLRLDEFEKSMFCAGLPAVVVLRELYLYFRIYIY